jgi:hypothetical protein
VDEDDQMAAMAHQEELERRHAEEDAALERSRVLTRELNDETRIFQEHSRMFWERFHAHKQEL